MNLSLVKTVYSKLPYMIKAPFSKFLRKKLIDNALFKEHFEKLQHAASWTDDQLEAEQFKLYKDTLIHAYEHTKYYKELFDSVDFNPYEVSDFDSIKNIPVLTKRILKEKLPDLLADDISDSYLVTTGGTSGELTKVMMTNDAYYIEWAFVYDFWSKYGYDIHSSKLATFRGINLGKKLYEINPMYQEIRMNVFSMSRRNIEKYVKEMKEYGTDFIYGYPSAIYNFCKLVEAAGISVNNMFKAALLISENLYHFQEEKICEVLKCPIGMFYGHSERAVFASRFDKGYQFNPLYGIVEISEKGNPIVTGFINKKTPLIRYVVDDRITEIEPDIFRVEGHWDSEVIYGMDGEAISSAAINFHDKTFDHVSTYQFRQSKAGYCTLYVVPSKGFNEKDIHSIKKAVSEKLGHSIICEVEAVDCVSLTERGKYKMIVQSPELIKQMCH